MKQIKRPTREQVLNAETYEAFREALLASNCDDCPLAAVRTNLVIDRGNPKSQIMLVGEAPGQNEDLAGKAFVGRSGKLLDALMLDIGIDTNKDCLITNVVKCRPPKNRPPTKTEVAECLPLLLKQIELMKPRVVVLLGATAAKHLVPAIEENKQISMRDRVGRFFQIERFPGVDFMVLYHPAYLLRVPPKTAEMKRHLETVKRHLAKSRIAGR